MPDSTSYPSPAERDLEASLRQLAIDSDAELRRMLVDRIACPLATMRAGNVARHRDPQWYSAIEAPALARMGFTVADLDLEFPVPAASPSWHAAEFDAASGRVFRFFVRSAWLVVVPPPGATRLRIRVLFGVHAQAIAQTTVRLDGEPLMVSSEREVDGIRTIDYDLAHCARSPLTLHVECIHAGIPSRLHLGSTDNRRLSSAVAKPEWLTAG